MAEAAEAETKLCASCGRRMTRRRRWDRNWGEVRYCSAACRRRKVTDTDRALERAIEELLSAESAGASICPSQAARAVAPEGWRSLREPTRRAARRLAARGRLQILQGGKVVDPPTARGPIRLRRLARKSAELPGQPTSSTRKQMAP